MSDADAKQVALEGIGLLSTTPPYAETTLCPDVYEVIAPLVAEVDRLRARVAELEASIRACFDDDDLIPLGAEEGEQWYWVTPGGQKSRCFGVSTLETQELRRLVPRLPEEEQE